MTDTTIEIFKDFRRIASHKRLYGRPGQYSTVLEHMPPDHQKYLEWNGDRFRKWAETIGINTYKVVNSILTSGRVEQQSYRACMGLLKLAERKSSQQLETPVQRLCSTRIHPAIKVSRTSLLRIVELNLRHLRSRQTRVPSPASPVVPVITEVRDHDKSEYN